MSDLTVGRSGASRQSIKPTYNRQKTGDRFTLPSSMSDQRGSS